MILLRSLLLAWCLTQSLSFAIVDKIAPEKNVIEERLQQELQRFTGDEVFPLGHPILYHPEETKQIQKIYASYGPLYLIAGTTETFEAPRPWAGYWYPLSDRSLYQGSQSPLGKLDQILKQKGLSTRIRQIDETTYGSLPAEMWEGFCHSWAFASILTPEPKASLSLNGVFLSIQDQKALRTRLFERPPQETFGVLYQGTAGTDGTYQDLRPEGFHQLATYLLEQKQPFVMDQDAGAQVWSKPVFRFRYQAIKDPEISMALRVRAELVMVRERNKETTDPTGLEDTALKIYQYRLYVDKTNRVLFGEWLEDSYVDHPDFIMVPKAFETLQTSNPDLNQNMSEVLKLIRGT